MVKSGRLLVLCIGFSLSCWAQSPVLQQVDKNGRKPSEAKQGAVTSTDGEGTVKSAASIKEREQVRHLTPVETVLAKNEVAAGFADLDCDANGNLYLGPVRAQETTIREISPKGELVAKFEPATNPDVPLYGVHHFALSLDGDLYLLVGSQKERSYYVLIFRDDGIYKSNIKLQPGFLLIPAAFAVFPNGNLLVTGQEYDVDTNLPLVPFTGIFRSDGKLLKEVTLDDDKKIHDMAIARDPQVMTTFAPRSNRAVTWGRVRPAKDGNIYLMRWLSSPIFYAISPGGEVVRHFTVDPGSQDWTPVNMHVSENRIAVLFRKIPSNEKIMKIMDLEGHEEATYDELWADGKPKLGPLGFAYACYSSQPERFTFLVTDDKYRIELRQVEPR